MSTKDLEQNGSRPPGKPWSVPDASAFLGISVRTLWRLIAENRVNVTRIGKRVLIPDGVVRKLAEGK